MLCMPSWMILSNILIMTDVFIVSLLDKGLSLLKRLISLERWFIVNQRLVVVIQVMNAVWHHHTSSEGGIRH